MEIVAVVGVCVAVVGMVYYDEEQIEKHIHIDW